MQRPTAHLWARVSWSACRSDVVQVVVHASTVAFVQAGTPYAVVLAGPSGSGKSSLALELMALGAQLVSDDQTVLRVESVGLFATAPDAIRGLVEWRGVGLLPAPALECAQVVAWMEMGSTPPHRLPEPAWKTVLGVRLPCLHKPDSGPIAAGLRQYIMGQAWMTHGEGRI
jgi:HPr kinase/phosphorylase